MSYKPTEYLNTLWSSPRFYPPADVCERVPSYQPLIHTSAERELDRLDDADRERLTDTLAEVARERQPTHHADAKMLEGQPGLFRVRVGDTRAICKLDKPNLLVLEVGYRKDVYESIDSVDDRLATV